MEVRREKVKLHATEIYDRWQEGGGRPDEREWNISCYFTHLRGADGLHRQAANQTERHAHGRGWAPPSPGRGVPAELRRVPHNLPLRLPVGAGGYDCGPGRDVAGVASAMGRSAGPVGSAFYLRPDGRGHRPAHPVYLY